MAKIKPQGGKLFSWWPEATPDQAKDTGMAMVLICLLLGHFYKIPKLFPVGIILLLVTMAVPKVFRPLAGLWFGLSHLMGNVVSKVLLTLIYFLLVTPIGLIRRWAKADSLQLLRWKKADGSVFVERQGAITGKDLENPY
jgi:hypothetical protein